MPIQRNENHNEGSAMVLDIEGKDCEINSNPKSIGWNIKKEQKDPTKLNPPNFFAEVQESHKQITDRFVDLLNLFEDYSKIMENEQAHFSPQSKLKRTQSEQFTAAHTQPEPDSSELLKTTVSLNRMQLSDCTLLGMPRKLTFEASCQTSWIVLPDKEDKKNLLTTLDKPKGSEEKQQQSLNPNQHTLHIEVESVSSTTALQRAPLRQRLWQVVVEAWQSLIACFNMMGENFTYVLFVLLCMWCLYLIIAHYSSFLDSNLTRKYDIKHTMIRVRGQPTQT
ncbi:uncharacterized protein LOC117782080 [Drosophila innubila]|uniref:uncharacterized protein LOC117782080 n=1 Tax=Drosophila innubila TaxID=198719 RepID=UPI00148BC6E2|nr:uncharacterized protein LOC117782080 [Drosophila innubila]